MADKSGAVTVNMLDSGNTTLGGSAQLEIFSGTKPATADTTKTGLLLVTFPMDATAFGGATDQGNQAEAVANITANSQNAVDTADAGYWRIASAAGANTCTYQGTVTVTGGGGELTFDDIGFSTGGLVTITSFKVTLAE